MPQTIEAGPGGKLRAARERAGLTTAQVAAQTYISTRFIDLIEANEFQLLPARSYATGFSRTYAQQVGLDGNAIAAEVRQWLDAQSGARDDRLSGVFEPGDPARIPSRSLAWLGLLALLLLLIGGLTFYRDLFMPGGTLPELHEPAPPVAVPAAKTTAAPTGPVVFTAQEDGVWVKFYDGEGRQLLQKEMALGEQYAVPAAAQGPQLWTGRPDALAITVGGRAVPRLAEREGIMKDVLVTPEALLARKPAPPAAAATNSPTG